MDTQNKYNNILLVNKLLIKMFIGIILLMLIFFGRELGCFSKLRYTNLIVQSNQLKEPKLNSIFVDVEERYGAYLADDDTKKITDKYINEISNFLRECYGVEREVPEYKVFLSDKYQDAVTVIDEKYGISIVISKKYMQYSKQSLHPVIIHELFHAYNAYDGRNCIYYDGENIISCLVEGYTELLTDEFCEYYNYDYAKRCDGTAYKYYCYLVEMFLENDSRLLQQYYFYKDTAFAIKLNKRLRENAKVSDNFLALGYYEKSLKGVISDYTKESKEKFLATLEMTLYYFKSEENKDKYNEYLDLIIIWYEEKYPENKLTENQKQYLYSIINEK